jgi:hypothetical protein
MSEIPIYYQINDKRINKDLRTFTISGYKRTEVSIAFNRAMLNSKLEDANRWLVELHSSGHIEAIFKEISDVYMKYIHIKNPYFLFYYSKSIELVENILMNYPKPCNCLSRNNQELRNVLAELVSIICTSTKTELFSTRSLPKVSKYAFHAQDIRKRMIAKNTHNIYQYLNDRDPNEVKIALNEIVNLLYSDKKTFSSVTYWYLWLKKISMANKKLHKEFICKEYDVEGVACQYRTDWVWPLWNILLDYSAKQKGIVKKFINRLYTSYTNNYRGFNSGYKQYILFFCFYICTNTLNLNIKIRQKEHLIIQAQANINKLYGAIEEKFIHGLDYAMMKKRRFRTESILTSHRQKAKKKMVRDERKIEEARRAGAEPCNPDEQKRLNEEISQQRKEERMNMKMDALLNFVPTRKKEENLPIKHYFKNIEHPQKTINFDGKAAAKSKKTINLLINKNPI